jgi:O-antigen/teichoic acid export membrane protein
MTPTAGEGEATAVPQEAVGVAGSVRRAAGGSALQMAARTAAILLQTLLVALLSRELAPGEFAALAAALAVATVVDVIADFGLSSYGLVAMARAPDRARRISGTISSASMAMLGVAVVLVAPVALGFDADARWALVFLLPQVAVNRWAAGFVVLWQHRLGFGRLAAGEVVGRVVGTGVAAAVLASGRWSGRELLAAVAASLLVGALVTVAILGAGVRRGTDRGQVWPMVRAAAPVGVIGVISLIHVRADQILLALFDRERALADYAVAYRAVESAVGMLGLMSLAAFAVLSRSGDRRDEVDRGLYVLLSLAGIVTAALLGAAADPIAAVLGGSTFAGSADLVRLLAPLAWISVVNGYYARICILEDEQRWLLLVATVATVVNVALTVVAIPVADAPGAAAVTLLTETCVLVGVSWRALRGMGVGFVARGLPADLALVGVSAAAGVAAARGWSTTLAAVVQGGVVVAFAALHRTELAVSWRARRVAT